jgi:L-arabinonolactonase
MERLAPFENEIPLALAKNGSMRSTRMNDGRVDPAGRFVVGGYDEVPPPEGESQRSAIYCLDPASMTLKKLLHGVQCTNSICFSGDGGTMYFTDSLRKPRQIFRSSTYGVGGELNFEDPFVTWSPEEEASGGLPDGSVIDSAGHLWNAQFGLGRVVRYDAQGHVDFVIRVPVSHPTCLAFGGPGLRTVFITVCSFFLTAEQKAELPDGFAGGLFVAQLPEDMPGGCLESKFKNT